MERDQIEMALLDPAAVFGVPEDVLSEQSLTKAQKIEILRRWEDLAAEAAVALEDGIQGEENDLLRRILVTLGELAGPIDVERKSTTKRRDLSRDAVPKTTDGA